MKKITLLIASLFAGASTLDAKYAEEILNPLITTNSGVIPQIEKKLALQIDLAVGKILDFETEGKTPAQIEAPLFRALILKNALKQRGKINTHFIPEFLLNNSDSFKGLITYVTNQTTTSFLFQFHKVLNQNPADLGSLLVNEVYKCEQILQELSGKTLDTNEQKVVELVNLELMQLKLLQDYLNNTDGDARATQDCLKQLKETGVQKATILRQLTPFLLLAAAGGAVYVATHHGEYIAQLAMDMYNKTGQFILAHSPEALQNFGAKTVDLGSSALGGAGNLASSAASGTSAIAKSVWNSVPTIEAATAMVKALPGMVTSVEYKALAQLIEKITESGLVTPSDQVLINKVAVGGAVSSNEMTAMNRLTAIISDGSVKVQ